MADATYEGKAECVRCGAQQAFTADSVEEVQSQFAEAGWRAQQSTATSPTGKPLSDWTCPACVARDPKIDQLVQEKMEQYSYAEQATLVLDATLRRLRVTVQPDQAESIKLHMVELRSPRAHDTLVTFLKSARNLASKSSTQRTAEEIHAHRQAREAHAAAVLDWERTNGVISETNEEAS